PGRNWYSNQSRGVTPFEPVGCTDHEPLLLAAAGAAPMTARPPIAITTAATHRHTTLLRALMFRRRSSHRSRRGQRRGGRSSAPHDNCLLPLRRPSTTVRYCSAVTLTPVSA